MNACVCADKANCNEDCLTPCKTAVKPSGGVSHVAAAATALIAVAAVVVNLA